MILQNLIMLPQHTRVVQACSTQTNIVVNEQFSSYQINLSSLKEPRHSEDLCLPHTLTLYEFGESYLILMIDLVAYHISSYKALPQMRPAILKTLCRRNVSKGYNLKLYNWNYLVLQLTETHKLYTRLKLSRYIKVWNH